MARAQRTPLARTRADYLQRILTARVYDVAEESPLEPARALSRRLGNHVLLKREDQQSVFSFKLRGAYNKMAHLTAAQLARGVICASAGNHAQGVAMSAGKLNCRAVIVMPTTTTCRVLMSECRMRSRGSALARLPSASVRDMSAPPAVPGIGSRARRPGDYHF